MARNAAASFRGLPPVAQMTLAASTRKNWPILLSGNSPIATRRLRIASSSSSARSTVSPLVLVMPRNSLIRYRPARRRMFASESRTPLLHATSSEARSRKWLNDARIRPMLQIVRQSGNSAYRNHLYPKRDDQVTGSFGANGTGPL